MLDIFKHFKKELEDKKEKITKEEIENIKIKLRL